MIDAQSRYEDGTYLAANPTWHVEQSAWKARQIARLLARRSVRPDTVADVGCGAGGVLSALGELLPDATRLHGYDVSPQAFAMCRERASERVAFFQCDPTIEDRGRYDLVLAIDVAEHVEDCYGYLRRLRALGEWKVLNIPLDISAQTVIRGHPLRIIRERVGHLHFFVKDIALAVLADCGYEVVEWVYAPGAVELDDLGWRARLLRLPRRLLFALDSDLCVRVLGGYSLLVLAR